MLSEDVLANIDDSYNWQTTKGRIAAYRAIEAAVLEEQAKVEPTGHIVVNAISEKYHEIDYDFPWETLETLGVGRHALYLHPSLAPEGMVLVPREVLNQCLPIIEAAINRAVKENFGRCDENAHKYIDLLDAMTAAAEKP